MLNVDPMQEHYGFSDEVFQGLVEQGVGFKDLFKAIPLFDPYKTDSEINKVGLLYYIDQKGDFNDPPRFAHKKIAAAIFEGLNIKDKIMVAEYIDFLENGEDEDDEDE